MRTALVIEVEELVFDTLDMRATALHGALAVEGVPLEVKVVRDAHAGVSATVALATLAAVNDAMRLDDLGRELVLRRSNDMMTAAFSRAAPAFDPAVRNALLELAVEFPLAVVTRASRAEAQQLLDLADLDACFTTIRSLADLHPSAHRHAWAEAWGRTHAVRGVAFASARQLPGAVEAGLRTVAVGTTDTATATTQLESLTQVDASFIASLF